MTPKDTNKIELMMSKSPPFRFIDFIIAPVSMNRIAPHMKAITG